MRQTRANPGRVAAARVLLEVEAGGHAEQVLARVAPRHDADRRLAWHIALGVLRHRGQIDASLRPLLRQPLSALDQEVIAALRLGAFESMFSRTKAHAVVDQAVEVVKALGAARAKGLVNAVVRRVQPCKNPRRHEALNHPQWLVDRWVARYGCEAVDRWCAQNNTQPPLYLVIRPEGTNDLLRAFSERGLGLHAVSHEGESIQGVYRVEGEARLIADLPGYDEGAFWVQDVSSVLAADLAQVTARKTVLDVCAAPGGKAFRLAAAGASVTACDISLDRLQGLRDNAARLKIPMKIEQHDAAKAPFPTQEAFDVVLVDAPCTGLGTLRRKPEIRWRRTPLDGLKSAKLQTQILSHSARCVTAGGVLIYSVCSAEPEEGADVVSRFLAQNDQFRLDLERNTAPPQGDLDAFYMARMVRQ